MKILDSDVALAVARLLICGLCGCSLLFTTGCGPSRPDPLAVQKDGPDDEDEELPKLRPPVNAPAAAASPESRPLAPAAVAQNQGAVSASLALFDTSYLPAESELFVYLRPGTIVRSPLSQTILGKRVSDLQPLLNLTSEIGMSFDKFESITVSLRNLQEAPVPDRSFVAEGLAPFSVFRVANWPVVQPTIVLRADERIDETEISKRSIQLQHGGKRIYRLKTGGVDSPCMYMPDWRILVVSDEDSIRKLIDGGNSQPSIAADLSFVQQSADVVVAVVPHEPATLVRFLPESGAFVDATRSHAVAAAVLVNLAGGVSSTAVIRCDSSEGAGQLETALNEALTRWKASETTANWSAGLQTLVRSVKSDRRDSLMSIVGALPEAQLADLGQLPQVLLGASETSGSSDEAPTMSPPQQIEQMRKPVDWVSAEDDGPSNTQLEVAIRAHADWKDLSESLSEQPITAQKPVTPKFRFSDDDDDDRPTRLRAGPSQSGVISDDALRVVVELQGESINMTETLGRASLSSVETDRGDELSFEGALYFENDVTDKLVAVDREASIPEIEPAAEESNGDESAHEAVRIEFFFTRPESPVQSLKRMNGEVTLRVARKHVETVVPNVDQRVGKKLVSRDLQSLGVIPVAVIEKDRMLVRLLEGRDEQITSLRPVDTTETLWPA